MLKQLEEWIERETGGLDADAKAALEGVVAELRQTLAKAATDASGLFTDAEAALDSILRTVTPQTKTAVAELLTKLESDIAALLGKTVTGA